MRSLLYIYTLLTTVNSDLVHKAKDRNTGSMFLYEPTKCTGRGGETEREREVW